jgi:hypothetical protein
LFAKSVQTAEFTVASIHGKQDVILSLFAPEAPRANKGRQGDYEQVRTGEAGVEREGEEASGMRRDPLALRAQRVFSGVVVVLVTLL